jgi:hypothetical protein
MSSEHSPTRQRLRARFGRIPAALEYAGVSRARLYQWAQQHPGLFRKNGTASLVDFCELDRILDGLPTADLKAPPKDNAGA